LGFGIGQETISTASSQRPQRPSANRTIGNPDDTGIGASTVPTRRPPVNVVNTAGLPTIGAHSGSLMASEMWSLSRYMLVLVMLCLSLSGRVRRGDEMARTWHALLVETRKTGSDLRLCWWAILGLNQ
jgi:hypothetical protein